VAVVAVLSLAGTLVVAGAPPALAASITSGGPLTRVEISPVLNCAVSYLGDVEPQFFGDTACATLLAVNGTLFGPASIPFGGAAAPRTPYTPVSQSAVTGIGTTDDPYTIVTVVALGTSGLRITQADSYVVGQEAYRTDVTVSNLGTNAETAILYRAGDCYLQNSDFGFGRVDPVTGAVACVAGEDDGHGNTVPGSRIEQWVPLSPGSHYMEGFYDTVWARIGAQLGFPDTCACANHLDNGAGLSWGIAIPPGGSVTRSHLTHFSPQGRVPLTTSKTADSPSAIAGATDGYTITVHNPNTVAAGLASITDTLPPGFIYRAGSTSGATTADPAIAGQTLTWVGPMTVPAAGTASIHFEVTVSSVPGDHYNDAGADGGSLVVLPTGDTAPIAVLEGPIPTNTTYTGASGASSAQYSDPVTLSGTLLDVSGAPVGVPGKELDFTLGSQTASAGPTDSSGNASTELTVIQAPGSVSTVETSFAGDDSYGPSNDSDPFSIMREDCTLAYVGDTRATGSAVTLAAHLGESDDALGDRSDKPVMFTVVGPGGQTSHHLALSDPDGTASTSVPMAAGTHTVEASFAGDDSYLACGTAQPTEVVVAAQGAAKVTGGGQISVNGRTSFAFEVIRDARSLRGQLQVVVHATKGRFHADELLGLSVAGNTATWWGTGDWSGASGYAFAVQVVDVGSGARKRADTISMLIVGPGGVTVYSTRGPQPLEGGNLSVH